MCIRDRFQVELILSEEDSDRACIVDVGDTGMSYVIPWSSIPPVSYTHLDVYKRQELKRAAESKPYEDENEIR